MMTDFGGFHMDITTYTMILVCKLWILAFAYKDGGEDPKTLTADQLERRVVEMPNIIEYSSYVFFSCGCIVGPVFEYTDFKDFMELKGNYKTLPTGGFATILPALRELLGAVLVLGIHIGMVLGFGLDIYFCGSEEFITYGNIWKRIGFYFFAMTSQRFMYYTPWQFNDAATKACGLAYSGSQKDKDGNLSHNWKRVVSIEVIALETSYTPVLMMAHWNHTVHLWLKHYVQ
jgi:lysophospholipid acyltransferase